MVSLYHFAKQAELGERIRWKGENSDVEKPKPRTVKRVIHGEGYVTVEAEGPRDGRARFRVEEDGSNEAFYGKEEEESMGPVDVAELVDRYLSTGSWSP